MDGSTVPRILHMRSLDRKTTSWSPPLSPISICFTFALRCSEIASCPTSIFTLGRFTEARTLEKERRTSCIRLTIRRTSHLLLQSMELTRTETPAVYVPRKSVTPPAITPLEMKPRDLGRINVRMLSGCPTLLVFSTMLTLRVEGCSEVSSWLGLMRHGKQQLTSRRIYVLITPKRARRVAGSTTTRTLNSTPRPVISRPMSSVRI
mmetsp:Transcript_33976/g.54693  ORF Transcript_33976/g.54693 Transcript_33976/m.54693 type:complete len:206 (-) Transcript_33976:547-1164(-)